MRSNLVVFLQGFCAASAWAVGLFFLSFWRETRDRFFAYFGIAFWMLAGSWLLLGVVSPTEEQRPYIYALRLAAFLLFIAATIDKNRSRRR